MAEFKVDDTVEIVATTPLAGEKWLGFRAKVIEVDESFTDMIYLQPLGERPDGRSTNFYWDTEYLRKVSDVPMVTGRYASTGEYLIVQSDSGGIVIVLKKEDPASYHVSEFRNSWEEAIADLQSSNFK